jgi:hypothetical protein
MDNAQILSVEGYNTYVLSRALCRRRGSEEGLLGIEIKDGFKDLRSSLLV